MNCRKCNNPVLEEAKFCSTCGASIELDFFENKETEPMVLFESHSWSRADGFRSGMPVSFDIFITKDFLYLIKIPTSNVAQDIALHIPLGIVGAIFKIPIVSSVNKKIIKFRELKKNEKLPTEYNEYVFLKIPKEKIKESIKISKDLYNNRLIKIKYDGSNILLKQTNEGTDAIIEYVNLHF